MLIGICDNSKQSRTKLVNICAKLNEFNILTFSTPNELLHSIHFFDLDLLFLAIDLNDSFQTEIDIKNYLEQINSSIFVVFCSNRQEFMSDAFGHNVLSFIRKPASIESVKKILNRASHLKKDLHSIQVNHTDSLLCGDILYLKSDQKYTIFYCTDGSSYASRKAILEWATLLEPLGFYQISRSAIINLKHYTTQDTHENIIILQNSVKLKLSRRRIAGLKSALHNQ